MAKYKSQLIQSKGETSSSSRGEDQHGQAGPSAALPNVPSTSMFQGCIAVPVLSHHRNKRKHAIENNSHLFTVESMSNDDENNDFFSQQPIIEEQWAQDAKKAKLELEEYEDVD